MNARDQLSAKYRGDIVGDFVGQAVADRHRHEDLRHHNAAVAVEVGPGPTDPRQRAIALDDIETHPFGVAGWGELAVGIGHRHRGAHQRKLSGEALADGGGGGGKAHRSSIPLRQNHSVRRNCAAVTATMPAGAWLELPCSRVSM